MAKGKNIVSQLAAFEDDADLGDLRNFNIAIDVRGQGTQQVVTCVPKAPTKIDLKVIFGEGYESKLHNPTAVVKPLTNEQMTRILEGEDYGTVVRGNQ
jgi:hypothetical protein